jgi:hypothetical protein
MIMGRQIKIMKKNEGGGSRRERKHRRLEMQRKRV